MDFTKMTMEEIGEEIHKTEKIIQECRSDIKDLEKERLDIGNRLHESRNTCRKCQEEVQEYATSIRESLLFGRQTQKTGTEEELESVMQTTRCMLDCHSEAVRNKINCDLDIHEFTTLSKDCEVEIKKFKDLISEYKDDISKMEDRLYALDKKKEDEKIKLENEKFIREGGLVRDGPTMSKCYFDGTTIACPHFVYPEYSDNDMLEEWKVKVVSKCKELGINIQVYPKNSYCSELNGQWNFIVNIVHDDNNYVYMIWRDANERVTYGSPICHPGHVRMNSETGRYEPDEFPLDKRCPVFKTFDRCIKDVFVDYRKIRDFARL